MILDSSTSCVRMTAKISGSFVTLDSFSFRFIINFAEKKYRVADRERDSHSSVAIALKTDGNKRNLFPIV